MNTEIIQYNEKDYQALCKEMTAILQLEKEVAERKKIVKEQVIKQAGGERLEFGIKVMQVTVKGRIDYNKLVTDWEIDEATLEDYRAPTAVRWDVRNY